MAQISERPLNSSVAPIAVFGGHADHQLPDLVWGARTTTTTLLAAIIFPRDQSAMPGQQRLRRDQRGQFVKNPSAQFLGPDRQASTLVIVQAQPSVAELFPKNSVLFLEVVDDILLLLVQPAREGNHQQSKRIQSRAHRVSVTRRQRVMTRP